VLALAGLVVVVVARRVVYALSRCNVNVRWVEFDLVYGASHVEDLVVVLVAEFALARC